jgi:L-ascorbate metabolism protein UlaG (beta-lactamase superfamily)
MRPAVGVVLAAVLAPVALGHAEGGLWAGVASCGGWGCVDPGLATHDCDRTGACPVGHDHADHVVLPGTTALLLRAFFVDEDGALEGTRGQDATVTVVLGGDASTHAMEVTSTGTCGLGVPGPWNRALEEAEPWAGYAWSDACHHLVHGPSAWPGFSRLVAYPGGDVEATFTVSSDPPAQVTVAYHAAV